MKLLFLDIETTPNVVYTWDLYRPFIQPSMVIKPAGVLCVGAKWADGPVQFFSTRKDGEKPMLQKAHALLDQADAVCHYYGTEFDTPRLHQEFARIGLMRPTPAVEIDLKKIVAQKFRLASNKLAFVAPYFGLGEKISASVDFDLWKGCLNGDAASWRLMERYNRQDVALLPLLYKKLLPYIDNHPNMNHWRAGVVCVNCGGKNLRSNGVRQTNTMTYRRVRCLDCGKPMKERLSLNAAAKPALVGL